MRGHPSQTAAALVITIGLTVLMTFITLVSFSSNYFGMVPNLPVLVVGGGIALLAAVAFTVTVLSFFGLVDKTEALGLPDGSVRAIIALLLIVVFAIMGVHFFDVLNDPKRVASADMAKQLVTILGTLVASISSFYFGSAAVASATASASPAGPAITGVTPSTGAAGTTVPVTISGSGVLQVDRVNLSRGGATIPGASVLSSAATITCSFAIPALAEAAPWDIVVETPDRKSATLPGAFSITAAAPGAPIPTVPIPTVPPTAPQPALLQVVPPSSTQGSSTQLTVTGTNLQLVTALSLRNGTATIPCTAVAPGAALLKADFDIPAEAVAGQWDVVASTSDNLSATLPRGFEIKLKS